MAYNKRIINYHNMWTADMTMHTLFFHALWIYMYLEFLISIFPTELKGSIGLKKGGVSSYRQLFDRQLFPSDIHSLHWLMEFISFPRLNIALMMATTFSIYQSECIRLGQSNIKWNYSH